MCAKMTLSSIELDVGDQPRANLVPFQRAYLDKQILSLDLFQSGSCCQWSRLHYQPSLKDPKCSFSHVLEAFKLGSVTVVEKKDHIPYNLIHGLLVN